MSHFGYARPSWLTHSMLRRSSQAESPTAHRVCGPNTARAITPPLFAIPTATALRQLRLCRLDLSLLLGRLLQVCDQIGSIRRFRHAREGHAVSKQEFLGIGNKGIERIRGPDDPAAPERGRVPKSIEHSSLTIEHAVQARADALDARIERMTGNAFHIELLPAHRVCGN